MKEYPKPISASQWKLYSRCPRRWSFAYIDGFRSPSTEATELGTAIHGELEKYIKFGHKPVHPLAVTLLGLFDGHKHPPGPGTEAETSFTITVDDVQWRGVMDFRDVLGSDEVRVGDWKSSSDLVKYALRPKGGVLVDSEGKVDPQSTLYAAKEYIEGAREVHGVWAYVSTKNKKPPAKLVEFTFDREAVENAYDEMHTKAREINQLVQLRLKTNALPYRSSSCFDFHKPCEFAHLCEKPAGVFAQTPLDLDKNKDLTMSSFLDTIKKQFPDFKQVDAPLNADAPVRVVSAAPSEPPPPPESVPPPPPESVPPPPPPPVDEDLLIEKLAREYMTSPRRPGVVFETVEAGFVNAPEAEGKHPYATPEEAAIGEGVEPVQPKAKKPSKKGKKS